MAHINAASPPSLSSSSVAVSPVNGSFHDTMALLGSNSEESDLKYKSRLEQLKSHPLFGDLQMTLALDCLQSTIPFTLLSDSYSHPNKAVKTDSAFCTVSDKIIEQHVKLQNTLLNVRSYFPSLLGVYQQITEQVESQRYRALTYNCYSDNVKQLINWFYDSERQLLIDRIQEAIGIMSAKNETIISELPKINVGLLKAFPYGLGMFPVNSTASTITADPEVERPLDLSSANQLKAPTTTQPGEKKSRFLSKKAVAILQAWYQKHRDHPYATDDEVRELAQTGGITPNQVKKWMANTRARSYNTLTYNGGKHMLNSKIAMKKRLLHKYKIEPPSSSSSHLYNEDKTEQNSRLTASAVTNEKKEDTEPEIIDVETVSDTNSPDIRINVPTDSSNGVPNTLSLPKSEQMAASTSIKQSLDQVMTTSNKPSLEQVIERCKLKSSESEKLLKNSSLVTEDPNKSVLESLKDVVKNVSSSEEAEKCSSGEDNSSSLLDRNLTASKRYLSPYAKTILNDWFKKHLYRPYPTFEEKKNLASRCGISSSKVDTWFANKRNRTHNTKKLPPKYSHLLNTSTSVSD